MAPSMLKLFTGYAQGNALDTITTGPKLLRWPSRQSQIISFDKVLVNLRRTEYILFGCLKSRDTEMRVNLLPTFPTPSPASRRIPPRSQSPTFPSTMFSPTSTIRIWTREIKRPILSTWNPLRTGHLAFRLHYPSACARAIDEPALTNKMIGVLDNNLAHTTNLLHLRLEIPDVDIHMTPADKRPTTLLLQERAPLLRQEVLALIEFASGVPLQQFEIRMPHWDDEVLLANPARHHAPPSLPPDISSRPITFFFNLGIQHLPHLGNLRTLHLHALSKQAAGVALRKYHL
ncbi:hypothetical protein K438DRAFT_1775998 [Mycena galopus ATCC 62051]|nr:hypothetical protein K438DRAFT_1775998 [Mycena galopus ATCC 62051]